MEDTARAPFIAGLPSHQRDTDAMDAIESPVRIAGDFPPLNLDIPMDRKWTVLKPILQRLYCEEKRKLMVISEILTDEYGFRATESQYIGKVLDWGWGYPSLDLNVHYEKKWGVLEPVLRRLYLDEERKLQDIIQTLKEVYGFYASETSYKHQFGKWKWKRNIPKRKKMAMSKALETRANAGKESASRFRGKAVDEKKIRRHMKSEMRKDVMIRSPPQIERAALDLDSLPSNAVLFGNMTWALSVVFELQKLMRVQICELEPAI
ncbi:MAG: hypothetical protein MMC23_001560 [Stictis urceolatum]|nr:hypothetical protein [Stictis urceolata]